MEITAKHFYSARAKHGEGPVWHEGALWWVDIDGATLNSIHLRRRQVYSYALPKRPGAAVPVEDGSWLIADEDGLSILKPQERVVEDVLQLTGMEGLRINDGKCDLAGNFWFGSMHEDGALAGASLYRYGGDGTLTLQLGGLTISNGMAWSGDGGRFYFIDTPTSKVEIFDIDESSSTISNRRTLVEVPVSQGYPDGMCIDREGHLWVALWGGWAVQRYHSETGEVLARVELPVAQPSSCCFGGDDLNQLFITTSTQGLDDCQLQEQPLAGDLFVAELGVCGYAACPYRRSNT